MTDQVWRHIQSSGAIPDRGLDYTLEEFAPGDFRYSYRQCECHTQGQGLSEASAAKGPSLSGRVCQCDHDEGLHHLNPDPKKSLWHALCQGGVGLGGGLPCPCLHFVPKGGITLPGVASRVPPGLRTE